MKIEMGFFFGKFKRLRNSPKKSQLFMKKLANTLFYP